MKVHNFKQYWLLCFETFFTGSQIGTVVGLQVSGVLCWSLGWQSVFLRFWYKYLLILLLTSHGKTSYFSLQ